MGSTRAGSLVEGPETIDNGRMLAMGETGPEAAVKGVVEDAKGKAKEVAGAVLNKDGLRDEGRAQQAKASSQRDVAAKEAEAEKARLEAKTHEAEQAAHQNR